MGRRSRKRTSHSAVAQETPARPRPAASSRGGDVAPATAGKAPAPASRARTPPTTSAAARRIARHEAAPPAPWGRFPLMELCVLAAIVLGIAGFVVGGRTGNILLTGAVLMGSIAGLEVALREHLGGFRSHTLLLSGGLGIVTLAFNYFLRLDRFVILPIAVGVFLVAFAVLRMLFKRRSGGVGMKVR